MARRGRSVDFVIFGILWFVTYALDIHPDKIQILLPVSAEGMPCGLPYDHVIPQLVPPHKKKSKPKQLPSATLY